jgi:uncharacterized OB-fold protein
MTATPDNLSPTAICANCASFYDDEIVGLSGSTLFLGVCRNTASDQCGHVLVYDHVSCERFTERTKE